jgi:putative ABC transport system ATP-binding protein
MELSHVSRVYGTGEAAVWALRDVSLVIRAGDFVSIVGPSGSGKSTMLGLLGCLDVPTEGTITVGEDEVTRLADAARTRVRGRSIGFVFQQFHLIPHLDALGNVETALLYRALKPAERRERAMASLERVGLGRRADHRPVQLSGGEQQRVALARALVTEPKILLADEPTGNLDGGTGQQIIELLFELHDHHNTTLVLITHDLKLAARCERVVRIADGLIVGEGMPT